MRVIYWLIAIMLMAVISFKGYSTNIITYELIVDFGNDWTFIHDVMLSKEKCDRRAIEIKQELKHEKAKAYCIKRG
jgi:predicted small integral membrane protein